MIRKTRPHRPERLVPAVLAFALLFGALACSDDSAPARDSALPDKAQADKGGPDAGTDAKKPDATPDTGTPDLGPAPQTPYFKGPQGIGATSKYIIVASPNAAYGSSGMVYGQGFITLIDRKTRKVLRKINGSQYNTQHVTVDKEIAYIVNTGKLAFDSSYLGTAASEGGIDILDLTSSLPSAVTANIKLGLNTSDARIGAYGSLVVSTDGKTGMLGSGTRADLFTVDLVNRKVQKGPDSPIVAFTTPSGKNGLTGVRPFGNGVAVASFNSDELCVADSLTDFETKKICGTVGVQSTLSEGPIDVAMGSDGSALVLMSIANALYKIDVKKTPFTINATYAKTGQANNRILVHKGYAYIINSMSNNLQRVNLSTGASDLPFATLDAKSNPYDLCITTEAEGDVAWVTLQMADKVALVNLGTGKTITTIADK